MRMWSVRITHIPSGISSTVADDGDVRSTMAAKKLALSHIKSQLWARANIAENLCEVGAYELPNDVPYPYDLSDYKA